MRAECTLAAITIGADGCVIVTGRDVIEVPADPVAPVIDTTGAGDLYAAGFLYGLTPGATSTTAACSARSPPPR